MTPSNSNIYALITNKSNEIWMELEGRIPPAPKQVITLHQWRTSLMGLCPMTTSEWKDHFEFECCDVFVVRDGQVYSVLADVFPANDWTIDEYHNTYLVVDLNEAAWGCA